MTAVSRCEYRIHFEEAVTSELCQIILSFVGHETAEYIWHKESFNLSIDSSSAGTASQHVLRGSVDCTDCVDDEWLIVYLLSKISERWKGAVASVEDEDGQFLLIEGAERLPRWVTPGNAENRVWIHQGHLHLVPLEYQSTVPFHQPDNDNDDDDEGYIDKGYAVSLVRDDSIPTRASDELEQVVFERIRGYPAKMRDHLQHTIAYVPRDIAVALSNEPRLVSEAVSAFYERDPASLRAVNTMSRFPPSSAAYARLRLTRPLYSQLLLQRFFAPKPFLAAKWFDGLPPGEAGKTAKRRREIGMKLACGFEMLYSSSSQSRETIDPSSPAYKAFLVRLTESGYFEGEIEGSARWTFKERQARSQFIQQRADRDPMYKPFSRRVDEASAVPSASLVDKVILRDEDVPATKAEAVAKGLEDDDGWLDIDAQGLDDILKSRATDDVDEEFDDISDISTEPDDHDEHAGQKGRSEEDRIAKRAARMLRGMAQGVEKFVEGQGALEGAEFDDERSGSDGESDDDDERMRTDVSPEERKKRMDALVAGLQEEEWGSKEAAEASTKARVDQARTTESAAPKFGREKYDGASDSSTDDEEADAEGEEPVELDLEEEMDDFLKFATETLGLSEDQYAAILREREDRGAFVPSKDKKQKKVNVLPSGPDSNAEAQKPKLANPNLKDFDSLMAQMDVELAKAKSQSNGATPSAAPSQSAESKSSKPKKAKKPAGEPGKVVISSESEGDDGGSDVEMREMDEELAELLRRSGDAGFGGLTGDPSSGSSSSRDYNLVKNFLESFQSQGGFAGPAGTLSGRLGFNLPKDSSDAL